MSLRRGPLYTSIPPGIPSDVLVTLLKHVNARSLAALEETSPWVVDEVMVLWEGLVEKVFPTAVDDFELPTITSGSSLFTADGPAQIDWRTSYRLLEEDRKRREAEAAQRVRDKYSTLEETRQGKRARELSTTSLPGAPRTKRRLLQHNTTTPQRARTLGNTIISKAIKGALSSATKPGTNVRYGHGITKTPGAPAPVRQPATGAPADLRKPVALHTPPSVVAAVANGPRHRLAAPVPARRPTSQPVRKQPLAQADRKPSTSAPGRR
ncbi:hypothetical protein PYCC9005_005415 [Savitreella phatthalungensis]